jgi:two-component system KDP operon response regulator KdpE
VQPSRILVAEDDKFAQRLMRQVVEAAGWEYVGASDGDEAWRLFDADPEAFDAVITDVRMPRLDGVALCERIRAQSDVPIIITSALTHDAQVLAGIEAGADDYLTKPLNVDLLTAKVRRALERARGIEPVDETPLLVGEIVLDPAARVVTKGGRPLRLTRIGYGILLFLLTNKDRIVTPAQILREVWGEESEADVELLRAAMMRLRRVVEDDPGDPRYISTHVGLGYRMSDPETATDDGE